MEFGMRNVDYELNALQTTILDFIFLSDSFR